jgi:hypothetical protein
MVIMAGAQQLLKGKQYTPELFITLIAERARGLFHGPGASSSKETRSRGLNSYKLAFTQTVIKLALLGCWGSDPS